MQDVAIKTNDGFDQVLEIREGYLFRGVAPASEE